MANDPAVANSAASVQGGSSNGASQNGVHSAATALFQKAHAKMVTMQRVDEQLAALLEQRRKLQDELRCCQLQINEEFERIMHAAREGEERFHAQYADAPVHRARRNGSGKEALRLEVAESV